MSSLLALKLKRYWFTLLRIKAEIHIDLLYKKWWCKYFIKTGFSIKLANFLLAEHKSKVKAAMWREHGDIMRKYEQSKR